MQYTKVCAIDIFQKLTSKNKYYGYTMRYWVEQFKQFPWLKVFSTKENIYN